jgi:hypothetical protein
MADVVHHPVQHAEGEEIHHETSDVNVRAILIFLAAFVVVMVIVYLVLWGMFRVLESKAVVRDPAPVSLVDPGKPRVPPEPRLQVLGKNPVVEMRALREMEEKVLTTYGIADPKTGAVRIPINDAMRIALQRGFPVRAQVPAAGVQPSEAGAPTGTVQTAPTAGTGLSIQQRPVDEPEHIQRVPPAPMQPQAQTPPGR